MVLVRSPELDQGQKTSAESFPVVLSSDSPVLATQETAAAILAKQSGDPATSTLQGAANTALANILTKLIAAPATEALQIALNSAIATLSSKLPLTLGAKTSAQSLSVAPATDDLLRLRSLARANAIQFGGGAATTTSGPQVSKGITAPASGIRIVICQLTIQNGSATDMNIALGGLNRTIVASVKGSGIDWTHELRLAAATAFLPDVSAAAACHIAGRYYLENATTGVPV